MSWLADHLDLDDRWRDGDTVTWTDATDAARPTAVVDPFDVVDGPAGDPTWLAESLATQGFEADPDVEPIDPAELDGAAPLPGLLGPADVIPEPDAAHRPVSSEPADDIIVVPDASDAVDPPTAPIVDPAAGSADAERDLVDEPVDAPDPPLLDPVADAVGETSETHGIDDEAWSADDPDPFDDLPDLDG